MWRLRGVALIAGLGLCVRYRKACWHFRRTGGVTIVTMSGPPGHGTRRPDVAWPSAYRPLNSCRQTSGVTWWLGCWPTPARHRETANDENPNAAPPRG